MGRKWNTIKIGEAVMHADEVWIVIDKHLQMKGNKRSLYQIKLKNHERGNEILSRFSPDDAIELADLYRQEHEFLYADGNMLTFMHPQSYEQVTISEDLISEKERRFLIPNMRAILVTLDDNPVSVEMPQTVEAEVTEAHDAARGDTATSVTKLVKIETGAEVRVPGHINQGDKIKVRVEDGEFLGRS